MAAVSVKRSIGYNLFCLYFFIDFQPCCLFQLFPSYQAYISEPSHLAHLHSSQTRNNAFSMSAQIRQVSSFTYYEFLLIVLIFYT